MGFNVLDKFGFLTCKVPWPSKIPSHNISTTLLHGIMWSLFHIFSNPNCVLCSHYKCFKILFLLERASYFSCVHKKKFIEVNFLFLFVFIFMVNKGFQRINDSLCVCVCSLYWFNTCERWRLELGYFSNLKP